MGGVCADVFGGDALRVKRNPSSFFLPLEASSRLISHLGAAHSLIRRTDRRVCGGSAGLLHYSRKSGKDRAVVPRNINPRPLFLLNIPASPPPSSALPENDACFAGFEFLLITEAAIMALNRRGAAGTTEATAALRELAARDVEKKKCG